MHDLGKDWIFKSYSARDDDVYEEFMKEMDDLRIKVRINSIRKFQIEFYVFFLIEWVQT